MRPRRCTIGRLTDLKPLLNILCLSNNANDIFYLKVDKDYIYVIKSSTSQ